MSYRATGDLIPGSDQSYRDQAAAANEAARLVNSRDHRVDTRLPRYLQKQALSLAASIIAKRKAQQAQTLADRQAEEAILEQQQQLEAESAASNMTLLYIGGGVAVAAVLLIMLKKRKKKS